MATAGDGKTPYESGGDEEKFCERPFLPDLNEEPENDSQEAWQNNSNGVLEISTHQGGNSAGIHATTGISETEQMLKQKTFTRDGAMCSPPSSTIGLPKKRKHGDERDIFNAAVFSSTVLEEEIYSLKLTSTYKGSTIGIGKAPHHPATMEKLPNELLSNIFIRLLAKQLSQMRSVSKSWNALLSQSSFVKSHLLCSIHNNDELFLHFIDESVLEKLIGERDPNIKVTNFIKFPPVTPQFQYTSFRIIGSVNGLICCSYSDHEIHIWNPSLSAFLTLPPYSTPSSDYDTIKIYFRFGYDPKTDDYKVVKLTGFTGLPTDVVKWWLQVEVYSMRKGSWELITQTFPSHVTGIRDDDVACADGHDGHLHWLGYIHGKSDSERIVAFDLGSETFREIPLPDSTYGRSKSLRVAGGKLCVLSWVGNGTCDVWVMDEYGVAESWVKPHDFSQDIDDAYPFGFTLNNYFYIEEHIHDFSQDIDDAYPFGFTLNNYFYIEEHICRLVLYDPIANKVESWDSFCMYLEYGAGKVVEYVDSLVWVAPAKCQMLDGARQN